MTNKLALVKQSAHVEQNKINSVLKTIYFIFSPDIRTCKAEIK